MVTEYVRDGVAILRHVHRSFPANIASLAIGRQTAALASEGEYTVKSAGLVHSTIFMAAMEQLTPIFLALHSSTNHIRPFGSKLIMTIYLCVLAADEGVRKYPLPCFLPPPA
jgi:hypothetical protein